MSMPGALAKASVSDGAFLFPISNFTYLGVNKPTLREAPEKALHLVSFHFRYIAADIFP